MAYEKEPIPSPRILRRDPNEPADTVKQQSLLEQARALWRKANSTDPYSAMGVDPGPAPAKAPPRVGVPFTTPGPVYRPYKPAVDATNAIKQGITGFMRSQDGTGPLGAPSPREMAAFDRSDKRYRTAGASVPAATAGDIDGSEAVAKLLGPNGIAGALGEAAPIDTYNQKSGLYRIVKTKDANGNSVYTQVSDNSATPAGGVSRVYDQTGARADLPAGFNAAPADVRDLARQEDAAADPSLATAERAKYSKDLADARYENGVADFRRNVGAPGNDTGGLTAAQLVSAAQRDKQLEEQKRQNDLIAQGRTADDKRADAAARQAVIDRDSAILSRVVDGMNKMDADGKPIYTRDDAISELAGRVPSDPEKAKQWMNDSPIAETLRQFVVGRLNSKLAGKNWIDGRPVSLRDISFGANGNLRVNNPAFGMSGRVTDISYSDLGVPRHVLKALLEHSTAEGEADYFGTK